MNTYLSSTINTRQQIKSWDAPKVLSGTIDELSTYVRIAARCFGWVVSSFSFLI
jgi:hypothetical protein